MTEIYLAFDQSKNRSLFNQSVVLMGTYAPCFLVQIFVTIVISTTIISCGQKDLLTFALFVRA